MIPREYAQGRRTEEPTVVSKEQPTRSSGVQPNRVGESTGAFWQSLPESARVAFLAGAVEVLGGLGLHSPSDLSVKDVAAALSRKSGESLQDNFTLQLLSVMWSLGCRFDGAMLDVLDSVMRRK